MKNKVPVKKLQNEELLAKIHFADSLVKEKSYTDAITVYKEVLAKIENRKDLAWDITEINRKIGDCYWFLKDNKNAIEYYENTLKFYTNNRSIYEVLSGLYSKLDTNKTIEYYQKALALGSNESYFQNLTWLMIKDSRYRQKDIKEIFESYVDKFRPKYLNLMPVYTHGEERKIKDKKLNIAYVSTDLYCHAMMTFMLPIFETHNTNKYNFTFYSINDKTDMVTDRIKNTGINFVDLSKATPQEIARKIYEDKIDIVIDLAGYVNTKLFWLLYKPAPIQMQYLGFLNTYGMKEVDYLITDEHSIPKEMSKFYTEKPLYLPKPLQKYCFCHPKTNVAPCNPEPPCVRNGYITFGCFNNINKIDDYTIKLWSKLVEEIPNCKLMFYRTQMGEPERERLTKMLKKYGADMDRIIFKNEPQSPHFLIYDHADIALDPIPFSGLTITVETCLMGVPVLCLMHETLQSKGTSRININLGLEELNAKDEQDFIQKAKDIANIESIKKYREELRYKLLTSPIFNDYREMSLAFEDCFDKAWKEYCSANT